MSDVHVDPEHIDSDLEREDLEQTLLELIERKTDEDYEIHAAILSDRSETTLYLLVVRSRYGRSGDLILEERYFSIDLTDPLESSGYSDNGISRRISRLGSLLGLRIAYSAVADQIRGDVDVDPLSLRSHNGSIEQGADDLDLEIAELLDLPDDWRSDSAPDVPEETAPGMVVCRRCSEQIPESEALQFGSGDLGEFWICDRDKRSCEEGSDS